ncbi:AC4 protein [Tomato leaf curl Joydebpur virus-India [India/Ghazipur/Chilli/2007]]|nr:AC4 protein [Tomato leaf curl Joydebpur virus-India [India/Ghazipur/Chilli/2007]]
MGLLTCHVLVQFEGKFQCKNPILRSHIPNPVNTFPSEHSGELRALQMSKPTWRKTETCLIMEFSKSMEDQLEEVANLPTTHMPRQSIQGPSHRPSIF